MSEGTDAQGLIVRVLEGLSNLLLSIPGSPILIRYVKSSYQNDPVRSGIELFLCLFAIRYLLAPSYSTQKNKVVLSEEVLLILWASGWTGAYAGVGD